MKAIKTLLAVSVLTTMASTTHATVWEVNMDTSVYIPSLGGTLDLINFTGHWDDVTNNGIWSGTAAISAFSTTLHYTQTFTMDEQTGVGALNPLDMATCTANTVSACQGFSIPGVLFNTAPTAANDEDYQTPLPFTPTWAGGWSGQWTQQASRPIVDAFGNVTGSEYIPIPMNIHFPPSFICLDFDNYCQEPEPDPVVTPIPGSAWLLGSGLIGLIGATRRKLK